MRIYEGMFVLDDARSSSNWDAVVGEVRRLLERRHAEIFTCERWDERRLAYPIKGRNRAVYLLTRFSVPATAITAIQRDCQLSDTILRVLIVRDERTEKLHRAGLFPPTSEEPGEERPAEAAASAPEEGRAETAAGAPAEGAQAQPAARPKKQAPTSRPGGGHPSPPAQPTARGDASPPAPPSP